MIKFQRLYFLLVTSLGYNICKVEIIYITAKFHFQNRLPEFWKTTVGSKGQPFSSSQCSPLRGFKHTSWIQNLVAHF